MKTVKKIHQVAESVKSRWVERDEFVDAIILSLLTGADLLAIGPPGCAKSAVIKDVMSHLDMAKFSRQLNQFSTDKDLIGDINPKRFMETGERLHEASNTFLDCDIAFVDEVFKGSKGARAALLEPLADRQFSENGEVRELPLLAMFSASNELPSGTEDAAFFSRLQIRVLVEDVKSDSNRAKALWGKQPTNADVSITRDEILEARKEIKKIGISDKAIDVATEVFNQIDELNLVIDQRKRQSSFGLRCSLAQAQAWLNGHDEILPEDLRVASITFWSNPRSIGELVTIVDRLCVPQVSSAREHFNKIQEFSELAGPITEATTEQLSKLLNMIRELKKEEALLPTSEQAVLEDLRQKIAPELITRMGSEKAQKVVKGGGRKKS